MAWSDGSGDDLIWKEVSNALAFVRNSEPEWLRLERKIVQYFRRAYRSLSFHDGTCQDLINEYADAVWNLLFQVLSDREWLSKVDFVFAIDAAVKESFPQNVLAQLPQEHFERVVLAAHDRAFEEARFLPKCWELVNRLVPRVGKSGRKVYDALAYGRKVAGLMNLHDDDPNLVKEFVSKWADQAIRHLFQHSDPSSFLPEETAVQLFHALIEAGTLPVAIVTLHGQPPVPWPFIDYAVQAAYMAHSGSGYRTQMFGKLDKPGFQAGAQDRGDVQPPERPTETSHAPAQTSTGTHSAAVSEVKDEVCEVSSVEAKEEQPHDESPEG
mmetsp:Transcript_47749/g.92329  ORF Transcript_47749/g.92329 Transcript_47749/m.92329 type:complete len:326 (+) Transcript_47749:51-1028(+)